MDGIPDTFEDFLAAVDGGGDDEPETAISHDAIKRAAQRWHEFVTVTKDKGQDETTKAGYIFAGALGLEDARLDHAVEFLKCWTGDESPSQGTMGLLFGLLIADEARLERELDDPAGD